MTPADGVPPRAGWLSALRRYFLVVAFGNLTWESAHLPLYTIWHEGSAQEIVFAAVTPRTCASAGFGTFLTWAAPVPRSATG